MSDSEITQRQLREMLIRELQLSRGAADAEIRAMHKSGKVGFRFRDANGNWHQGVSAADLLRDNWRITQIVARLEDARRWIDGSPAMAEIKRAEARIEEARLRVLDAEAAEKKIADERQALEEEKAAAAEARLDAETAKAQAEAASAVIPRTGLPGRPSTSSWELIDGELTLRYNGGERHQTTAEWADNLLGWLQCKHPTAAQPKKKTLTNRLARRLRELPSREPADPRPK